MPMARVGVAGMPRRYSLCKVLDLIKPQTEIAVDLLTQFFVEEGFTGTKETITANTQRMLNDPCHWMGLAWSGGVAVGVVTVTTMLYIELGRLGEIGDLYVLPSARRRGIATALIETAVAKCRNLDCSAVSVVVTPEGNTRHGLASFYGRFGFVGSGRKLLTLSLVG